MQLSNDGTERVCFSLYIFYYLELLSSVHLSGPEFWRVNECIGVDVVEEMASV